MKINRLMILSIAAVLVAALLLGAQKPAREWEYARLNYGQVNEWQWMAPGISIQAKDAQEMCVKLGLPSNTDSSIYTIAEWAGSQGWELIIVQHRDARRAVGWFKRPK